MADFSGNLTSAILGLPRWWFDELAGLLPSRLRRVSRERAQALVLDVSGPELVISRGAGDQSRELGRVNASLDGAAQRRAIAGLLRGLDPGAATVVLRLAESHALRKKVELPLAAEENLAEVLAFEMDRHTPFKPGEVYFEHRLVRRDAQNQRLEVALTVVPRRVVDEAVAKAADWGLAPGVVDLSGSGSGEVGAFNLLPPRQIPAPRRAGGIANVVLGLAAVALMAAVIQQVFEREAAVEMVMGDRVAAAKAEAEAVVTLREDLKRLIEDGQFPRERKRDGATATAVLDELTRVLPDHTWIFQIRLNEGEARVSGYSSSASEIIALIEASAMFREVAFRSPVTRDARLGLERFNVSARVTAPGKAPQ